MNILYLSKQILRVVIDMKSCNNCLHYNVCKFKDEELCKGIKVKDLLHDCANFALVEDSIARCCNTCTRNSWKGVYSGVCAICKLCEWVPDYMRDIHELHNTKSFWEWRGKENGKSRP